MELNCVFHTISFLAILLSISVRESIAVSSPEVDSIKQLYNTSLTSYNNKIRPVLNQSHAVKVEIQFSLVALVGLDTTEQKFEAVAHFVIIWNDELLPWDPNAFYGTNMIHVSANQIWHPNIVYFKTITSDSRIGDDEKDILLVLSNGNVYWNPLQYLSTVCEVSVKNYPFDKQTCVIHLNDADLPSDKVTLNVSSTFYTPEHSEWKILSLNSQKTVHFSADVIEIKFILRRRFTLTMFTLIAPLIKMAVINVCIFLLPVTSGEKSSVAITLFLSYGVFIVATRDMMPANSLDVSLLVRYVFVLLVLSAFTVVFSLVESRVYCSYGDQLIDLSMFLNKRKSTSGVKVEPSDEEKDKKVQEESTETYTHSDLITVEKFLRWFDVFAFLLVFATTLIYSLVVFIEITADVN